LAFDAQGRLFVAENIGYPSGPGEAGAPAGRIALLEDGDGDGRMDRRTVFADDLTFPNGVLPWNGGVIVTCAPDVLFLKDHDGDGRADERRVLLTGFSTAGSTQLRVNAPTLGPDGWIYLAAGLSGGSVTCPAHPGRAALKMSSDIRFHPETLEVEPVDGRSQYGMSFDREGNRFICMNRVPVQHVVLESRWLKRNPRLAFGETVQDCNERNAFNGINGRQDGVRLFPISSNITTADGHAGSFSAACGVHVWQGGGLTPECLDAVLSCDPTGNLVHADRLVPRGATFTATPLLTGRELVASRDDWFRPVYLAQGPGGALYIADMYRKVIEHPDYLPEEVRKRTDFESGKMLGRIWRVVSVDKPVVGGAGVDFAERHRFLELIRWGDDPSLAATRELARVAARDSGDKWVRNAVLSGVAGREREFLVELLGQLPDGMEMSEGLSGVLAHLGGALGGRDGLELAAGASVGVRQALLSGYLSGVGRSGADLPVAFRELLDASPAMAADTGRSLEERICAVKLASRLPWGRAGETLLRLALDEAASGLSAAALAAVVMYPEEAVPAKLLAPWPRFAPARREAVLGALLGVPHHVRGVLAAVEAGRLPAAVFAGVRKRQILASGDPEVRAMAARLLEVPSRPGALEEARKALALVPVPAKGRETFRALCTACHRLEREGSAVGPDLFDIRRQSKENILFHLVNPDAEIAPAFAAYLAEARDGRVVTGILVGDTPAAVTLRGPLAVESTILRGDLVRLEALPGSLMPTGLEAGLGRQQLADLISYLKGEN
jgi:putative membrane-bound dehydrogenase-like protein